MTKQQKDKIKKLAQKYHLNLILFFGSQVSKKTHFNSDTDIAFLSSKELDYKDEYDISYQISLILKNNQIDLVNLKNASPFLKKEIMSNAKILYKKNQEIFDNYLIYSYQVFRETLPLFSLKEKAIKHFVKKYD
ncbi:MAG: nucleotidyltransferase domain-containing protein [Candidatus Kuenenbacteria bacterium]